MTLEIKQKGTDFILKVEGVIHLSIADGAVNYEWHIEKSNDNEYTWSTDGFDMFWMKDIDTIKVSELEK